jgi:CHASE3 domain sensor protein
MRLGLTGRILIGGGLLAAVFAGQFVIVLQSFGSIRRDTREQQRSQQSVVAAIRVEKLVLDLETGTRGYVITRDKGFLAPYEAARRALPSQSRTLMALAPGPRSAEIDQLWGRI